MKVNSIGDNPNYKVNSCCEHTGRRKIVVVVVVVVVVVAVIVVFVVK